MSVLKLNVREEKMQIISLYRDLYGKRTMSDAANELIIFGLKYKDLQRKKEGLSSISEVYESWKKETHDQMVCEKSKILIEERKDLIKQVVSAKRE